MAVQLGTLEGRVRDRDRVSCQRRLRALARCRRGHRLHDVNVEDAVHDVDVVLDTVGGEVTAHSWSVLKPDGILVTVAGMRRRRDGRRTRRSHRGCCPDAPRPAQSWSELGQARRVRRPEARDPAGLPAREGGAGAGGVGDRSRPRAHPAQGRGLTPHAPYSRLRPLSTLGGVILLIGRILFVALFVSAARGHIKNHPRYVEGAGRKLPFPVLAGWPAGVCLLVAAISIVVGIWADLGALMIAAFLVPAAVLFHPFWSRDGPDRSTDARGGLLPGRLTPRCRPRAVRALRRVGPRPLRGDRSGVQPPVAEPSRSELRRLGG